jgi:hypothetical protein
MRAAMARGLDGYLLTFAARRLSLRRGTGRLPRLTGTLKARA